jgi:hypothetical protein
VWTTRAPVPSTFSSIAWVRIEWALTSMNVRWPSSLAAATASANRTGLRRLAAQ